MARRRRALGPAVAGHGPPHLLAHRHRQEGHHLAARPGPGHGRGRGRGRREDGRLAVGPRRLVHHLRDQPRARARPAQDQARDHAGGPAALVPQPHPPGAGLRARRRHAAPDRRARQPPELAHRPGRQAPAVLPQRAGPHGPPLLHQRAVADGPGRPDDGAPAGRPLDRRRRVQPRRQDPAAVGHPVGLRRFGPRPARRRAGQRLRRPALPVEPGRSRAGAPDPRLRSGRGRRRSGAGPTA